MLILFDRIQFEIHISEKVKQVQPEMIILKDLELLNYDFQHYDPIDIVVSV